MRVFSFVLLLAGAQADEIASLHKWEQEYRSTVVLANLDASAANRAITGSHEPDATTLQPLWRWYRTVDAAHQAKAKEVMQGAGRTATAGDLDVAAVVDFQTKYDSALAATVTDQNAEAKAKIVYQVLGAHEPEDAKTLTAWKLYQAMDASTRAAVRTAIVEKPFLVGFQAAWKTAISGLNYKEALTLMGNTMRGTKADTDPATTEAEGVKTLKWYEAISKASPDSDDALLKRMRAVMMQTLEDTMS